MKQISVNNLLGIKYLSKDDINLIFETADSFKEILKRKIKKVPTLKGVTIANLFFENSTRTKLSFELAEKRLSADIINFSKIGSSISKGETLIDTVNNILAMKVDMIIIRHPSPGAAEFLTRNTNSCPFVRSRKRIKKELRDRSMLIVRLFTGSGEEWRWHIFRSWMWIR